MSERAMRFHLPEHPLKAAVIVAAAVISISACGIAYHEATAGDNHDNVITTVFWVGEPGDSDNGNIPNAESAWDGTWQQHYGGIDGPDRRNGYNPAGFTPKENSFYAALPYNDIAPNGSRKADGDRCKPYNPAPDDRYSYCKNDWIAVTRNGRTAYLQLEDVGPFEEDDAEYVFSDAAPKNTEGEKAGLDISPAAATYLGVDGLGRASWRFVTPDQVPDGPWKEHVTTSKGYTVNK
jgi:hypothetical protein